MSCGGRKADAPRYARGHLAAIIPSRPCRFSGQRGRSDFWSMCWGVMAFLRIAITPTLFMEYDRFRKPLPIPDQVRDRLFRHHASTKLNAEVAGSFKNICN